jgi:hypothetical protein
MLPPDPLYLRERSGVHRLVPRTNNDGEQVVVGIEALTAVVMKQPTSLLPYIPYVELIPRQTAYSAQPHANTLVSCPDDFRP